MVVDIAVLVRPDVGIQEPYSVIFDQSVRIFEVGETSPHRFHLGSGENDARLKFFQQEVVMGSDPINSSVSVTRGSGIPARRFLRIGLSLVCGLARHGSFYLSS